MKQPKVKKSLPLRFFEQGELYVEDLPGTGGKLTRLVRMRFKTIDIVGQQESPGVTPWVTFTPEGLEQLSAQLAAVAESAKQWKQGETPPAIGSNLGIALRHEKGEQG